MKRGTLILSLTLLAGMLLLQSCTRYRSCWSDYDCYLDEFCDYDGYCSLIECFADDECPLGSICEYICVDGCFTDIDCQEGFYCGADKFCYRTGCTKDSDCRRDEVCTNGKCKKPSDQDAGVDGGDTDGGTIDGGTDGGTDAGENTLGTGDESLIVKVTAADIPSCPNACLYPDLEESYKNCTKGTLHINLIRSDNCNDMDAPHLLYTHPQEVTLDAAGQSITLSNLPGGFDVLVCPWLDTNKTGAKDDGDLISLKDRSFDTGVTAKLGFDADVEVELGHTYYVVDREVATERTKILVSYLGRLNFLDLDTFKLTGAPVQIKYNGTAFNGTPFSTILPFTKGSDSYYIVGNVEMNAASPATMVLVKNDLTQPGGLDTKFVQFGNNSDFKDAIFYELEHDNILAIDTLNRLWHAESPDLMTTPWVVTNATETGLWNATLWGDPKRVAHYNRSLYFSAVKGASHYMVGFNIDTGPTPFGPYPAGEASVESGAIFAGNVGGTDFVAIGNKDTISVFKLNGTLTGTVDVSEWGQDITRFVQTSDGKLFALPASKGTGTTAVEACGDTGTVGKQSILQLIKSGDTLSFMQSSAPLEYDIYGYEFYKWALERGATGTLPGNEAAVTGDMVITGNFFLVSAFESVQDQILLYDRTNSRIVPFGYLEAWDFFIGSDANDPFGLWPVEQDLFGNEVEPAGTRVKVRVIHALPY